MKKIVLVFLTILSISAGLALDTDTHKYIVFVSKHQNVEGLKANGYSKKSQPSEQMQFVITKNSDTVIQELVFKDQAEQDLYAQMEADGSVFQYEISRRITVGGVTNVVNVLSKPIPVDLDRGWSVKISS